MKSYRFRVALTLAAPLLSQASGGRRLGLDAAALRSADGRPALPGTLVRGNLREAWEGLRRHAPELGALLPLLGEPSPEGDDDAPRRGRLGFAPLWRAEREGAAGRRHRTRIDPATGAVAAGALQAVELPYAVGERVRFDGWVEGRLDAAEATLVGRWLRKGLEYLPALGAFKGAGFGRLLAVEVGEEEGEAQPSPQPRLGERFGLVLTLDRPFCFSRPRSGTAGNNRFESEDLIPGGAIKGVLARRLGLPERPDPAFAVLCRHFDRVRIGHAFPEAAGGTRPVWPPFSLAADGKKQLFDLALKERPGLLHNEAPAFQPDWKEEGFDQADALCGWGPRPPRRLTLHNRIDRSTGRPAHGALFAVESVEPVRRWLAEASLSAVPEEERQAVAAELGRLLAEGLDRLGKTEACASVELLEAPPPAFLPRRPEPLVEGRAVVTLQSAARLLPDPWAIPPSNGDEALSAAYAATWEALSGGALRLSHYFARQALVGGGYLQRRFRRDEPYNPELLTLPGSLFVLAAAEGREEEAAARLEAWEREGLPAPPGTPGGDDWRHSPYLAANGYGEVRINLALHWEREPKGREWNELD